VNSIYDINIGDIVTVMVPAENREWGYDPCPDGTLGKVVGFDEIVWAGDWASRCGFKPGVYVNRYWAHIEIDGVRIPGSIGLHCLVISHAALQRNPIDDFIRELDS